ncbi:hypothetical protein AC578_3795 [Pseudocercospora eumusae]|uniref:Alpha/beta hydrolase fold-3 domain-containing protein n=1 Tax=Pseudocercospora eumusae TaxID=321146 RepID=A0A139HFN9_9PEZI|nr:hypothetical protein AC578_3795 [Pseudocercospora eumusae]
MSNMAVSEEFWDTCLRMRKELAEMETKLIPALGPISDKVEEFYHSVKLPDGHEAKLKIWRPKKLSSEAPLIVLFHGGGYFGGSLEMCTRPGREYAEDFGAVVVSAAYRLSPEHAFPGPVHDGLDIITWLDQHAEAEFGANLGRGFVVGGFSAGGTLTSVTAQQLNSKLKHKITGHFIAIPWLFMKDNVPEKYQHLWKSRDKIDGEFVSQRQAKETLEKLEHVLELHVHDPLFSPVNYKDGLSEQPRTYIQVGGKDALTDDGVIYAKLLEDAGVEVKIDSHADLGHECFSIFSGNDAPPELKNRSMAGMAWLLGKEWVA